MPIILDSSEIDGPVDVPSIMIFTFPDDKSAQGFFGSPEIETAFIRYTGEEDTWGIEATLGDKHDVHVKFLPPLDPSKKFTDPVACLRAFGEASACCESQQSWTPHGKDAIIHSLILRAREFSCLGAEDMPCAFFVPESNMAEGFPFINKILMFPDQSKVATAPEPLGD